MPVPVGFLDFTACKPLICLTGVWPKRTGVRPGCQRSAARDVPDSCGRGESPRRMSLPVFVPAAPRVRQCSELPQTGHWKASSTTVSVPVIRRAEAELGRCGAKETLAHAAKTQAEIHCRPRTCRSWNSATQRFSPEQPFTGNPLRGIRSVVCCAVNKLGGCGTLPTFHLRT